MQYKKLGKTGLEISSIGLGNWITFGSVIDKETTFEIIDKAYESGINLFDCIHTHNNSQADKIFGESLGRYPRESIILSAKPGCKSSRPTPPNHSGLSKKFLYTQLNTLLTNLNVDYIDIFSCYCFDNLTDLYETMRIMDDFIRQGKILYIGVSEWTASQIIEGLKIQDQYLLDRIVVTFPTYNLINRSIEKEVVQNCINNKIGIISIHPLAQGFLTGKYRKGNAIPKDSRAANESINSNISSYMTPENFDKIEKFIAVANKKECSPAQLAITWQLTKPGIDSIIMGATKISHIEENIAALDIKLSEEEIIEIENIFENNIDKYSQL
ncbi:MAG: aldo/keto reductase [Brevinemataceae bacterium]